MGMHVITPHCKYTAFLRKWKWEIKILGYVKMTAGYIIQESLLSQRQNSHQIMADTFSTELSLGLSVSCTEYTQTVLAVRLPPAVARVTPVLFGAVGAPWFCGSVKCWGMFSSQHHRPVQKLPLADSQRELPQRAHLNFCWLFWALLHMITISHILTSKEKIKLFHF